MENIDSLRQVKETKDIENATTMKKILETDLCQKQANLKQLNNTVANLKKNVKSVEPTVADQVKLNSQFHEVIANALSKFVSIEQDHNVMKTKFKELSQESSITNLITEEMFASFCETSHHIKDRIVMGKMNLENSTRLMAKQMDDFEALRAQKQLEFTATANRLLSLEEENHQLIDRLNCLQIENETIYNNVVNEEITKENLQIVANSVNLELIDSQKTAIEFNSSLSKLESEINFQQDMLNSKKDKQNNLQLKLQQLKDDFIILANTYNKICEEEGLPTVDVSLSFDDPVAYAKKLFQTFADHKGLKIQEQMTLNCEKDALHFEVVKNEKELVNLSQQYDCIQQKLDKNRETVDELKKNTSEYSNILNEIPLKQSYLSKLIADNEAKMLTRRLAHEELQQSILQKQHNIKEKIKEAKKAHDIVIDSFKANISSLKSQHQRFDTFSDHTKRKIALGRSTSNKWVKVSENVDKPSSYDTDSIISAPE